MKDRHGKEGHPISNDSKRERERERESFKMYNYMIRRNNYTDEISLVTNTQALFLLIFSLIG